MGAVADAVLAGGGKVIGVIPDVKLIQERRHPGLTECIETKDMAERKQKMIELADAYVALPGGPGTLDEISEVICPARLGIENKACVLFDTDGYYQALKKIFEEMVEVGFSEKKTSSGFWYPQIWTKLNALSNNRTTCQKKYCSVDGDERGSGQALQFFFL